MKNDVDHELVALVNAADAIIHAINDGASETTRTKHSGAFLMSMAALCERYGDNLEGLEVPDGVLDRFTGVARISAIIGAVKAASEVAK